MSIFVIGFWIVFWLFWLISGVLAYALAFAWLQRNWPESAERDYRYDMSRSMLFGAFGPLAILVVAIVGSKYGMKFL